MLGFLLVSVAVAVFAAVKDFNDTSVNMLFYWTYAMDKDYVKIWRQ